MERLVINLAGGVRQVTKAGRQYLVAPATLIIPGVLNGSQGPLYYPIEEIRDSTKAWNGVPVTVDHPRPRNGRQVSASDPSVQKAQVIGHVSRARANGKLAADLWFDVQKTAAVDNELLRRIQSGQRVELSTGLLTSNEPAENGAQFNGRPYTHVARNYRPDHLAVLPNQVGACSVQDGCGVFNEEHESRWDELEDELLGNAYNPNQPRDADGKFGSGGGSGGGGGVAAMSPDDGGTRIQGGIGKGDSWESPKGKVEIVDIQGDKAFVQREGTPFTQIHATKELPEIRRIDEANAKSRKKVADKQKAEAEEKAKVESLGGFDAGMTPMAASKARAALQRPLRLNGVVDTRKNHMHALVEKGYERKGDRLESPSGSFLLQKDVSKTAMEYFSYIRQTKNSEGEDVDDPTVDNQLSQDDLRSRLTTLLAERFGSKSTTDGAASFPSGPGVYVVDVFHGGKGPSEAVFDIGGQLQQLGFTVDRRTDEVTLADGDPIEVKRVTSYEPVENAANDKLLEQLRDRFGEDCEIVKTAGNSVTFRRGDQMMRLSYSGSGDAARISGGRPMMMEPEEDEPTSNAMKMMDGEEHPPSHFAYVPDPEQPSTWKLRIDDAAHVGGAIAAIGKGFRGQKVSIPKEDLPGVKRKLRAAWLKFHEDKTEDDLPDVLTSNAEQPRDALGRFGSGGSGGGSDTDLHPIVAKYDRLVTKGRLTREKALDELRNYSRSLALGREFGETVEHFESRSPDVAKFKADLKNWEEQSTTKTTNAYPSREEMKPEQMMAEAEKMMAKARKIMPDDEDAGREMMASAKKMMAEAKKMMTNNKYNPNQPRDAEGKFGSGGGGGGGGGSSSGGKEDDKPARVAALEKQAAKLREEYDDIALAVKQAQKEGFSDSSPTVKRWKERLKEIAQKDREILRQQAAEESTTNSRSNNGRRGHTRNRRSDMTNKDRKKMAAYIVANCGYCDDEAVENMSDEEVQERYDGLRAVERAEAILNAAGLPADAEPEAIKDRLKPVENKKEETLIVNATAKPKTMEEWLEDAPEEVRNAFGYAKAQQEQQRIGLIEQIVENTRRHDDQAFIELLKGKGIPELELLASATQRKPVEMPVTNFLGQAVATPRGSKITKPIPLPDNWQYEMELVG